MTYEIAWRQESGGGDKVSAAGIREWSSIVDSQRVTTRPKTRPSLLTDEIGTPDPNESPG